MRPTPTAFLIACLGAALLTSGCLSDKKTTRDAKEPTAKYVKQPFVAGRDVPGEFDLLREAGLRVSISKSFTVGSLETPGVRKAFPQSGTRVRVGRVVTLKLFRGPLASLLTVCKPMPTWTVEDLRGLSLSEAISRVPRCFFWEARDLPPLHASEAAHLFDAYRVVSQRPAPGAKLQPGILGKGYRPTPVIFEAVVADDPAS